MVNNLQVIYILAMQFRRRDKKREEGPRCVLFYRDYITSELWEERKRQYFERYAKACKICGSTTYVQLNHIKYGNYGQERDRDLVPLCRDHHQALHDMIGVKSNMHYQTAFFLETEIKKYDAQNEGAYVSTPRIREQQDSFSVQLFIERLARPIWQLIYYVIRR